MMVTHTMQAIGQNVNHNSKYGRFTSTVLYAYTPDACATSPTIAFSKDDHRTIFNKP